MAHSRATVCIYLGLFSSALGVGIAYAVNKTPIIGTFSPVMNINVGFPEGELQLAKEASSGNGQPVLSPNAEKRRS